jgi:hypothetical protein
MPGARTCEHVLGVYAHARTIRQSIAGLGLSVDIVMMPSDGGGKFPEDKELLLNSASLVVVEIFDFMSMSISTSAIRRLLRGSIHGVLVVSKMGVGPLVALATDTEQTELYSMRMRLKFETVEAFSINRVPAAVCRLCRVKYDDMESAAGPGGRSRTHPASSVTSKSSHQFADEAVGQIRASEPAVLARPTRSCRFGYEAGITATSGRSAESKALSYYTAARCGRALSTVTLTRRPSGVTNSRSSPAIAPNRAIPSGDCGEQSSMPRSAAADSSRSAIKYVSVASSPS